MSTATMTPPRASTQSKGPKPLYKFRIHSGTYWKAEPLKDEETGEQVMDANGKPVFKDVVYGPGHAAGDIVETPDRLDKRHNREGFPPQFELLGQDGNPLVGKVEQAEKRASESERRFRKAVDALDGGALLDFAKKDGIDLKGETDEKKVRALILTAAGIDPRVPAE
jgi:hypothetical protein